MTPSTTSDRPELEASSAAGSRPEAGASDGLATRLRSTLSFERVGALYVLALIIVAFSILAPDTFPRFATISQIVDNYAITAMAALALIIPLSAGVFDVSGAWTMSLSGVIAGSLVANTGTSLGVAIVVTLLACLVVGAVNGLVVVGLGIESLIATLATGSLIAAVSSLLTDDTPIYDPALTTGGFADISQGRLLGVSLPVFYVLVIAVALWYLMEHTATGRRLYATGFNLRASQLAGVRTQRLQVAALLVSSLLAGATGIVLASNIGSGSPTVGEPYLLTSFAAVFLGATQFKEGRFNAPGTIVAVLLIGTGVTGLALVNAGSWVGSAFTGVVLICALAVTRRKRSRVHLGGQRRGRGAGGGSPRSDGVSTSSTGSTSHGGASS